MVLDLAAEFVMGRVCQGPSLSWAEFVMGRDVPESSGDCRFKHWPHHNHAITKCIKWYQVLNKTMLDCQNSQ